MTELRNARADLLARQDEALALNLEDLAKSLGLAKEALPGAIEQITKAVTDILTDVIAKVLRQAATTRAGDVMLPPAPQLPDTQQIDPAAMFLPVPAVIEPDPMALRPANDDPGIGPSIQDAPAWLTRGSVE